MIVVLVYRPEVVDDSAQPFDGVEVYGVYLDAEEKAVMGMIDGLMAEHPQWQFTVSEEKLKVGFDVGKYNIPRPAGGNSY